MTTTSTQVQLVRRPQGWPVPEDFRTVTVDLPDLGPDQVRVANEFLSVDPYMRGRMNDAESYVAAVRAGRDDDRRRGRPGGGVDVGGRARRRRRHARPRLAGRRAG